MPLITYNRLKTDFPNNEVHAGQLFTEIENSDIVTKLNKVFENTLDVSITFENELTTEEENTLNNIISNHNIKHNIEIHCQTDHNMLMDDNVILTIADLQQMIIVCNPTANRTITLPNASEYNMTINESFDFSIINQSTTHTLQIITNTIIGYDIINPQISGQFRLRITDINTPAYTIYRIS